MASVRRMSSLVAKYAYTVARLDPAARAMSSMVVSL
jgi:hypothetical protein